MIILSVADIQQLIATVSLNGFLQQLFVALQSDFRRWHEFKLSARHATHYAHGVIELMPCSDDDLYAFKYVNGHPANTSHKQLCVVAIGQLSDVASGYPLMLSEMTLLTALRTAATGVLAASYLAKKDSKVLAIIGCGAQAEFQVSAFINHFQINEIRFYDIDELAMAKFSQNCSGLTQCMVVCHSITDAIRNADIVITATAAKQQQSLFKFSELAPGAHIQAMGGDCPGKTELDSMLLKQSKVVVEYKPQSLLEGDMQHCDASDVYAELWELVSEQRSGRENNQEITVFDSVGFALEDYSILRTTYDLARKHHLGTEFSLIPELTDPKNLFSLISPKTAAITFPTKRKVL